MEVWVAQQQTADKATTNNSTYVSSDGRRLSHVPRGHVLRSLSAWSWVDFFGAEGCSNNGTDAQQQPPVDDTNAALDYSMLYGVPLFWLYLVGQSLFGCESSHHID